MAVPATPGQALGPSIHQATFFDKLDLIPGLLSTCEQPEFLSWLKFRAVLIHDTVTTVLYAAVTAPFRGGSGAYTFNQHVSSAGLRKVYHIPRLFRAAHRPLTPLRPLNA